MPKLKTVKGAAKRFKLTASGRVKYARGNRRHILTKKSRKRKRQARRGAILGSSDEARIKAQIPHA